MRSWRFHEFGDISNLRLEDIPTPEPGAGEILVRVQFAALNPEDQYLVRRLYPRAGKPPFAVGRDGSGTVAAVGPETKGHFAVGDPVVLLRSDVGVSREGTLADYVTVPEASLAALPKDWTFQEGAAGPLVFLTAWQALVDQGQLKAGENVLITVALSRSKKKRAALNKLGAHVVIDTESRTLEGEVRAGLRGEPVHLVVENLGGEILEKCLRMMSFRGRIQVVGLLSGLTSEIQLGLVIHKCLKIQGISMGAYTAAKSAKIWAEVVKTLERAGKRPLVDRAFDAESVQAAFAHMAKGPLGKVLVDFRDDPANE